MKHINCDVCGKTGIPFNDTIKIDSKNYCEDCLKLNFSDQKQLEGRVIEKNTDLTVCAFCAKDNGTIEFDKIAEHPVCPECNVVIKNRAFPLWVKAFFAGIMLLVGFSIYWNWRFYEGYSYVKQTSALVDAGDFKQAAELFGKAGDKVPENTDLKVLQAYFTGLDLMMQDKPGLALKEFAKCEGRLPENYDLDKISLSARIGDSFDNKDYAGFLILSKQLLYMDTTSAQSWAGVASAYACLYAVSGADSLKQQATNYLLTAKNMDPEVGQAGYYDRINHRLATREIISRQEFEKKYPKGWGQN